jgi:pyruvate dehydrogenase E2 component (dihydrolipoyllysine-residue acetyltransferase)
VARDLTMPKLSDSMEEATILHWLKEPGDAFSRGEPLAEIETDKATVVYEAESDGVLASILVPEGESARMGDPIATLGGETVDAPERRPPATPVARRRAEELGVSLHELEGTGPGGRITVQDVEDAAGDQPAPAAPAAPQPASGKGEVETVELTSTQKTIARRMEQAASIPTFMVTMEIDMSTVVALRQGREGVPSVNDFLVRAVALTLRELPAFNSSWIDGRVERYSRINVGIAVAVEGALLVPTLFDADRKSLAEIAAASRDLAERARARTLTPEELTSSTFTVSNLGMYGVHSFTAIVDPPQVAILAVGGITDDGRLLATLSADHRVVYGADGAAFLAYLKDLLEQPAGLVL